VRFTFRNGFIGGVILALGLGIYLLWLWQPDDQVQLYSDHFMRAVEARDWNAAQNTIASDYEDDWGNNRARLLERMRAVLQFTRNMRIRSIAPNTLIEGSTGTWMARIEVEGGEGEVMAAIKQRINPLTTPFKLQWHRQSAKPWDWKLIRVSNRELQLPGGD
jgi:hypothetical protein